MEKNAGHVVLAESEKLRSYASHLLDDMILLREKYAMLKPMLFDSQVTQESGSGKRARGFLTLQRALFLSCAQDAAKIASDKDKRSPSIHNIITKLQSATLRAELRESFAVWNMDVNDDDPEIQAALRRLELAEEEERRLQFDGLYSTLVERWNSVEGSAALNGIRTIRNKISAHTELRRHVDRYSRVELGSLGLKWGDLGLVIDHLQELVELIGLIIRNASFAWDMLNEQTTTAAQSFWMPTSAQVANAYHERSSR